MTNLDHELRGLTPFIDLPPERDLAPAVRARIGARRPRPGRLVVALALLGAERREELFAAVNRLEEHHRQAIACRYFLDLSEEETAAALGCRRGTVKSRLARALERLRTELGEEA
jgi:DNA-directed RNA polymerase specialized sigma24 family protein